MATLTLEKMAAGGIYDQIGGGFHRYSTDARWLVPHFEKMLYDNALLAVAYAEAYQVTGRADFAARRARDAGLRAARDDRAGRRLLLGDRRRLSEGERGQVLRLDARRRSARCSGRGHDARLRFMRLLRRHARAATSRGATSCTSPTPDETRGGGAGGARARRCTRRGRDACRRCATTRSSRPGTGSTISALGGRRRASWARRATSRRRRARRSSCSSRCAPAVGCVRSFKDGRGAASPGFLDDYAFLAAGLFDLYEATFDARWLREALALVDRDGARCSPTRSAAAGS